MKFGPGHSFSASLGWSHCARTILFIIAGQGKDAVMRQPYWYFDQVGDTSMNLLILVVDDEPDVEMLFRAQFRRDLRQGRFRMEFAPSGDMALQRITDATGLS